MTADSVPCVLKSFISLLLLNIVEAGWNLIVELPSTRTTFAFSISNETDGFLE
jgi:hypothetical protein